MGDVVNLRRARKQRVRAEADEAADRNRATHGRTKAERAASDAARAADAKALDGHLIDDGEGGA